MPKRRPARFSEAPTLEADLPDGFRLQVHERAESTNALAAAVARDGDPGRLWIVAKEQTAGRGRRGRSWDSPPGNLYSSLLLVDAADPGAAAGTISFVAGIALDRALADVAGPESASRLALKWPNDLLCDRKKVAGILVEGEETSGRTFTVIGIGVNCRSHPDLGGTMPSGDLRSLGFEVEPEALFRRLAHRMAGALTLWDGGRNFTAIREAWLARAAGIGAGVHVAMTGAEVEGAFETVDSIGRMVVRLADGSRKTISAGDATIRFAGGSG
jgi:BirA family biotin operon repressor/biotin-[acetyl-CoA-carboxylase] ligase